MGSLDTSTVTVRAAQSLSGLSEELVPTSLDLVGGVHYKVAPYFKDLSFKGSV